MTDLSGLQAESTSFWLEVGPLPPPAEHAKPYLFHDPRFFHLHSINAGRRGLFITVRDDKSNSIWGMGFAIEMSQGLWQSPGRGTFGGIQWFRPINPFVVDQCYAKLEESVLAEDGSSLTIILPPEDYSPWQETLTTGVLKSRGYILVCTDLNFSTPVNAEALQDRMKPDKKYGVGRAIRKGITTRDLLSAEHKSAYRVLSDYKQRRGLPMTMTEKAFNDMITLIPGSIIWTGAFLEDEMIGASVTLQISSDILSISYTGHSPEGDKMSVQQLLISSIYAEAQHRSCRLLDFGIATRLGVRNEGLITFKTRLGFRPGQRTTWSKRLGIW
ncbi:GNAT family N-acetyltransferase [Synechococcus sp. CS-1324]|uniref:GNAT family N-acetyltransferase n=1 Tax=Synechococcus sp. CS-1324 TaxID=2847980 RepID=UPI00223C2A43|nr:GNAT family N-acetyltransferase [Synechococcus sp. CS-1324]MCT0231706.1 GNAT family N-acetyltransferase [Synechococcus sp. CS-1324]